MEINEFEQKKMNFWILFAISYASILLFILISIKEAQIENFEIKQYSFIAIVALLPTLFVYHCGRMTINLIKSIPKYIYILVALAIVWFFVFGERTYEDCILNHAKDTASESATVAIKQACRKKYGY
jgi:protein-S-isoprenylcysteine O-methyltransferase Ste14